MVTSHSFKRFELTVDALTALHTRVSAPRLEGEPEPAQLQNIFKAALRAADHALLRPWRFLIIRGEAREKLGEVFAQAAKIKQPDIDEATLEKTKNKALRAPVIVVVMASIEAHDKVPDIEQIISAGAATQNMLVAAHAQGLGAMWRTGSMAYDKEVSKRLGVAENEKIVGFLYLGQKKGKGRVLPDLHVETYFKEWQGDIN